MKKSTILGLVGGGLAAVGAILGIVTEQSRDKEQLDEVNDCIDRRLNAWEAEHSDNLCDEEEPEEESEDTEIVED